MTNAEVSINGWFYDGTTPEARSAILSWRAGETTITSGDTTRLYGRNELRVSPRIGRADRFIKLPDGGQYHCADQPFLDQLPQEFISEGPVAWLENHLGVAIASVVIVIATLLAGYFYGLPVFTESIITRIPIETESTFGQNVLQWFDENGVFSPSAIDPDYRDLLTTQFTRIHRNLEESSQMKLEFRNSDKIGPNAFALPGGTIVITDQMVNLTKSSDEILAILAHEAGHVAKRHSMRLILESSLVTLAVVTVTGDVASLGASVSSLPIILLQTKHSRKFESKADEFAIDLLEQNDISPEAFATMFERLEQEHKSPRGMSFLSTHPITSERIKKARAASNPQNSQKAF